jgi:hypothetical protein
MTAAQVEAFYNHFDSVGWMGTHNRPICNLPSALAKWKAQESNFAQPSKGTVEKKTWPPELDDYVRQMKSEHTLVLAGKKEYGDFDRILTKVRNIFGKECVKEVRRRVGML